MTHITPAAEAHLIDLRRQQGVDEGQAPRFVAQDGKVRLTFASGEQPGDHVIKGDSIKVLVASELAARFEHAVINAREQDGRGVLVIQPRSPSSLS